MLMSIAHKSSVFPLRLKRLYLKRKSREPQRLQAIGNLHDVAKQILDDEVVILLRQYGTTLAPGRMGDESRVPKWLLVLAADRIEELKNARTKQ